MSETPTPTPRTAKRMASVLPPQLTVPMYAASRFLRRRLLSAAEIIKSSDFWLHTTPSKDCDIVITFPPNSSEYTVMWILTRLRNQMTDLEVHLRKHNMTGVYGLYLTASWKGMYREAESLRIRKRLKPEYGGGLAEFMHQNAAYYEGADDHENFLSSQERQSIVHHMLLSIHSTEDEELSGVKFSEGQAIIPKCLSEKIISQVFPLHNGDTLNCLTQTWVQDFFKFQPLDQICDYFGVKIAIYFAWLGHYTTALTIPAIFGVFLWICFYGNQATEDICFVLFAFFNVIWTTLYLESWKRRQAELAYRWGTLDQAHELLKEPRALFEGSWVKSAVTDRLEPFYPNWKRNLFRYCVSLPIVLMSLGLACITVFSILELEQWWIAKMDKDYSSWMSYLPKILLAFTIFLMDEVYHRVATLLNDLENYRLEEEYENHLTIKMGVFQFVSAFVSLFYIAFYLQNMEKLRDLLATLLIARQVIGNIKESCIPFIMGRCKLLYLNLHFFGCHPSTPTTDTETPDHPADTTGTPKKPVDRINISQAEHESSMFKYEGTFDDYLEMFIQFGYVMLFSSAFPMAAACAFLNNLIEIRSDAFKLCCSLQRPFGVRVANIGAWQIMMEIMGVIAIMVNCTLIGMSGQVHRLFPDLSTTGTLVLIVLLEHLLLTIKFTLAYAIPDIPAWVATEMAKVEFRRREALREMDNMQAFRYRKNVESKTPQTDPSPTTNNESSTSPEQFEEMHDSDNVFPDPFYDAEEKNSEASEPMPQSEFGEEVEIMPSDLIGIPLSNLIAATLGRKSESDAPDLSPRHDNDDKWQFKLRRRKRNSLPSDEALNEQGQSSLKSLPFLNLAKPLKLPSALKLGKKKIIENSKESNEECEAEGEPLIRKHSRRFSLFPHSKH